MRAQASTAAPQLVEVTAGAESDVEKRRQDTIAKSVYGRAELDRYGDASVADVLKRLPGVDLQGGSPRLRGLGAGYTLILLDGERAPPGFSLDNLPPSQVERIEVTKGPTAEHSAQAVAGTINIVLRQAARQRLRELHLDLGHAAGQARTSFNTVHADRWGALSATLPFSLSQGRGREETFSDRVARDTVDQPQHVLNDTRSRWWRGSLSFGPRLSWKASDALTLELNSLVQRNEFRSLTHNLTEVLAGLPPTSVDSRFVNRAHWQLARIGLQAIQRWPSGARLELKAGAQAVERPLDSSGIGFDRAGVQTLVRVTARDIREQGRSSSGKYAWPLGESHRLALGWDIESGHRTEIRSVIENGKPQLQGFDGEPFLAQVRRTALFAQDEWELTPQWSTYLGLRGERIATRSAGSQDKVSHASQVLTPLWHLNYRLQPAARDQLRASLTRSFREPELFALVARPIINSDYPVGGPNPESVPDTVGNAGLRPELSSGLDLAFEKYLPGGGVVSVGVFHRRVSGLIRDQLSHQAVPWDPSGTRRWVSRPVNLARAQSTGIELEVKGQAGDLLDTSAAWAQALSLRGSLSVHRSRVAGIPGPDNRLESQPPWSMSLGFDHRASGSALGWGANLAYTPGFRIQRTVQEVQTQGRARTLDAYLSWACSRDASVRLSVSNLAPWVQTSSSALLDSAGFEQSTLTRHRRWAMVNAHLKLNF